MTVGFQHLAVIITRRSLSLVLDLHCVPMIVEHGAPEDEVISVDSCDVVGSPYSFLSRKRLCILMAYGRTASTMGVRS
jgi:hypothetical protein